MKNLLILLPLLFSFQASANDLTQEQESTVLNYIDNTCADTWCEGDFDFSFNELNCDFKKESCLFKFDLITYDYESDEDDLPVDQIIPYNCNLNVRSFIDMVSINDTELQWDFYERLTDECISEAEEYGRSQIN